MIGELKQYVILGKDGRYHFSPNHPSEYEDIVGGINCEDIIVCGSSGIHDALLKQAARYKDDWLEKLEGE